MYSVCMCVYCGYKGMPVLNVYICVRSVCVQSLLCVCYTCMWFYTYYVILFPTLHYTGTDHSVGTAHSSGSIYGAHNLVHVCNAVCDCMATHHGVTSVSPTPTLLRTLLTHFDVLPSHLD